MMMCGSLQSPGGSILWNGINTGAKIHNAESDWWFEDISYLCVELFERLIREMEVKGIQPENLASAIMYYCKKYIPGLGRWPGGQTGTGRTVVSFSMTLSAVDQRVLLERIVKLLPDKNGKSFCRFLLRLLRVALILGVNNTCQSSLEWRIGIQLELATLDSLLIPSYSDSDILYNTECVERLLQHFVSSDPSVTTISPSSLDLETSPSSGRWKRVAKLVDSYIQEVASDVNLKPRNLRSLAEALPESSRSLHDGLYRALDIFFKMQLRTALAGYLHVLDAESVPADTLTFSNESASQVVQRDGWVNVVRENRVLKVDLERMRSQVGELEQEFGKIKDEMKKVSKSYIPLISAHKRTEDGTAGIPQA